MRVVDDEGGTRPALREARESLRRDEVPVGGVVVRDVRGCERARAARPAGLGRDRPGRRCDAGGVSGPGNPRDRRLRRNYQYKIITIENV